jgi:hypothetical protein
MVIVKSTDFGQTFSKPAVIAEINPFDQPTTDHLTGPPFGTSFRTNSYPTMTVDDNGIVYVAWTERGWGPARQEARIVLYTSQGGSSWSGPMPIENHAYAGHQIMPYLTFAAGKLTLAWYDQRSSASVAGYDSQDGFGVDDWISDINPIRQTIDIRAAQADPGPFPVFAPSVQVSRYLWALFGDGTLQQAPVQSAELSSVQGRDGAVHGGLHRGHTVAHVRQGPRRDLEIQHGPGEHAGFPCRLGRQSRCPAPRRRPQLGQIQPSFI